MAHFNRNDFKNLSPDARRQIEAQLSPASHSSPLQGVAARVRPKHQSGKMNRLEAKYAKALEYQKWIGDVIDYKFEAITLKLAHDTRYTPDFMVVMRDRTVEIHEVKGFMEDDARVKLKVAASMFPCFVFRLIQKVGDDLVGEEVKRG